MALPTLGAGIRCNLPILVKWLALGQSGNDHGSECDSEEPPYELEANLITSLPHLASQALEKLRDGQFSDPQAV